MAVGGGGNWSEEDSAIKCACTADLQPHETCDHYISKNKIIYCLY